MVEFRGYEIKKSTRQFKKYMAKVNNEWVHFGDNRYGQYKDRSGLGLYSYLDNNDEKRRASYIARHGSNPKEGTAGWFALNVLW